jgi:hypothetical protein
VIGHRAARHGRRDGLRLTIFRTAVALRSAAGLAWRPVRGPAQAVNGDQPSNTPLMPVVTADPPCCTRLSQRRSGGAPCVSGGVPCLIGPSRGNRLVFLGAANVTRSEASFR